MKPEVPPEIEQKEKRFAELVTKAQGSQSGKEFAEKAGISTAALSRQKKGGYTPSIQVIRRMAMAADPASGVTYEDLLAAGGYLDDVSEKQMVFLDSNMTVDEQTERHRISAIYTALADKRIPFQKAEMIPDKGPHRKNSGDFILELLDQPIGSWTFAFKSYSRGTVSDKALLFGMTTLFYQHFTERDKYSIMVDEESAFRFFQKFEHALPIRGEVSAVLYDPKTESIVKEVYLSNYELGDHSREVYLI